jgi:hypothetical protein
VFFTIRLSTNSSGVDRVVYRHLHRRTIVNNIAPPPDMGTSSTEVQLGLPVQIVIFYRGNTQLSYIESKVQIIFALPQIGTPHQLSSTISTRL